MKKLFILLGSLATINAGAQVGTVRVDSLVMGPGYLNDVYYNLADGAKKNIANNTWHLAFETGGQTDGIRINSATATGAADGSVKLYVYPKGNINSWSSFDTTGYTSWLALENTDTNWSIGAFNISSTGFPDFSWGTYSLVTHVVTGDSLYLIQYASQGVQKFKKLWIVKKERGDFTFKYANVDGSDEREITLKSADFAGRNFMYYNLETHQSENREPAAWDFISTRYQAKQNIGVYAAATGILTNKGVLTAKATGKGVADLKWEDFQNDTSGLINAIGYDWKGYTFGGPGGITWFTEDSVAYFLRDRQGIVWKLNFIFFGGATDGKTIFNLEQLTPGVSVGEVAKPVDMILYPNPTNKMLYVVSHVTQPETAEVQVLNAEGKLVITETWNLTGFEANTLNVENLTPGAYFIKVSGRTVSAVNRFIKN